MTRRVVATVALTAALTLAPTVAAFAGSGHGHTPIVVCHNVTHNPHIIVVDDDSTKLHAHLAHRDQSQLMDLVEGYDGTADQIRAACVPKPSPTTPAPSPTEVTPSTTTTTPASATTTTSSATSQPTSPSPTSSTPTTTAPAHPPTSPSASVPRPTSTSPTASSASPSKRAMSSPPPNSPSSTVAPPELAHTGAGLGLAGFGAALLGGGLIVRRLGRKGAHR